jgi:hypothetical protein
MTQSSGGSGEGAGGATLLTIAFIVLKLTHYISWSWWWVLSPVWIMAIVAALVIGIVWLVSK